MKLCELIQNTARRYAEFVQYFKPLLGKALSIKGLYPPPPTTPAPSSNATSEESVKEVRSAELSQQPATNESTTLTPTPTPTKTTTFPRVIRVTRAVAVLPEGTTDDTPDFNREQVMLDIPDQLFGNSFTVVTSVSKIVGDLMMVGQSK